MPDITELTQDEINAALAQLKLISEFPTPSTQYARVVRKYIATLVEAQKKAHSVMSGVVTAACTDDWYALGDTIDSFGKPYRYRITGEKATALTQFCIDNLKSDGANQ
uniref:hypothetical protein n=1 Tax=Raoultella ornithinolytica TaxID=54291 RepID=UPI00208DD51A|nr:hypothetical protein [Raoultella ornithinolytica]URQ56207.1 Hypothetical protein [Raoultella ornithinolytica]